MERPGQLPLNGIGSHRLAAVALVLLILGPWPRNLQAQAFIASRPHPEFGIGPLFVSVSIGKDDLRPAHRPLTLTVSWSLVLPLNRRAPDIAQDLYLLWPGEVAGIVGSDGADPALVRHVGALGFRVKEHGRLRLSARARSQIGTSAEVRTLGEAPFVTFVNDGGSARPGSGATYIRIPWAAESASLDWLVRLELPVRDVIVPKPVSWIEDMFWGRWYAITLGFGDLGSVLLYPLYFGVRDRVIPLARDFSMLVIEFADAQHLRVDDIVPPSASRQATEGRDSGEVISLALAASQGLVPQVVKVHFTYAPRRVPARPLLISAFLVLLGSLMRYVFTPAMSWIGRTLRARVLLSRAPDADRYRGMAPPPQVLDQIRAGETTYEDVLRLCGPGVEEQVRLPPRETQTLVYRVQRAAPRRGWSLGWLATVRCWDVEDREVEITFERNRVRDIQIRVRRSKRSDPPPA
jgi:hypothetical protein